MIATKDIVEIVPFIKAKRIPNLPEYVKGIIDYHGATIPIVDICKLLVDRASKNRLSTRIVVVNAMNKKGDKLTIGLVAERSTDLLSINEEAFHPSSMSDPDAVIVGDIAIIDGELLTKISLNKLIDEVDDKYFYDKLSNGDNS